LIHGKNAAEMAEAAGKALFGQADLSDLDLTTLDAALAQLPRVEIGKNEPIPSWVDYWLLQESSSPSRLLVGS
jgi:tyrosyl-tRNA synthetase